MSIDTLIADLEYARTSQERRAIEAAIDAMIVTQELPKAIGPYA